MQKSTNKFQRNRNPGHLEVVEYLVEQGANIDATGMDGQTAVHISSMEGNSKY